MKGIVLGFDGQILKAIHFVTEWDNAIQEALNLEPFDEAIVLDMEASCPATINHQALNSSITGEDGVTEGFPVVVTVVKNLDEANAKLPARHLPELKSPA